MQTHSFTCSFPLDAGDIHQNYCAKQSAFFLPFFLKAARSSQWEEVQYWLDTNHSPRQTGSYWWTHGSRFMLLMTMTAQHSPSHRPHAPALGWGGVAC